jgi:hypothetical protein
MSVPRVLGPPQFAETSGYFLISSPGFPEVERLVKITDEAIPVALFHEVVRVFLLLN